VKMKAAQTTAPMWCGQRRRVIAKFW